MYPLCTETEDTLRCSQDPSNAIGTQADAPAYSLASCFQLLLNP